jgi:hypothetical protein
MYRMLIKAKEIPKTIKITMRTYKNSIIEYFLF